MGKLVGLVLCDEYKFLFWHVLGASQCNASLEQKQCQWHCSFAPAQVVISFVIGAFTGASPLLHTQFCNVCEGHGIRTNLTSYVKLISVSSQHKVFFWTSHWGMISVKCLQVLANLPSVKHSNGRVHTGSRWGVGCLHNISSSTLFSSEKGYRYEAGKCSKRHVLGNGSAAVLFY